MDGLDFCFRERRWSEATCGHEECKRIGDIVTPYLCQLARLREEVERLTRERDALIGACIAETWQQRPRTLAEAEDDDRWECNWVWRISGMGDTVGTRDEAVAAVRRAAGLGAGGEGEMNDGPTPAG